MKTLNIAVGSALLLMSSMSAHAGAYQGYVTNVLPSASNNMVHVIIANGSFQSGNGSNCPYNGNSMIYSIDISTSIGKAMFETALASKTTGKLTYISGDGVCALRAPVPSGMTENMVYLDIKG